MIFFNVDCDNVVLAVKAVEAVKISGVADKMAVSYGTISEAKRI